MKLYKLYDQVVASDINLPEGTQITYADKIDIKVERGLPPDWVMEEIKSGEIDFISENIMWFYIKRTVLYYIENGNRILVFIEDECIPEIVIQAHLTGTAMCFALIQKGYIPIHGSTIVYKGKGVTISGRSGSGKSTVAMALLNRGLPFMSDDVSAIKVQNEKVVVIPGFPQQKVCRDTIDLFRLKHENLIYFDEDRDKFAHIVREGFWDKPLEAGCMMELIASETAENITWSKTEGGSKFKQLSCNIFRGFIYQRLERTEDRMNMFLQAAAMMPMYEVIHPGRPDTLDEVIRCIVEEILIDCFG